jgi:hypothetical protein
MVESADGIAGDFDPIFTRLEKTLVQEISKRENCENTHEFSYLQKVRSG